MGQCLTHALIHSPLRTASKETHFGKHLVLFFVMLMREELVSLFSKEERITWC